MHERVAPRLPIGNKQVMAGLDALRLHCLAQACLAPGGEAVLCSRLSGWLDALRPDGWVLDVGCGPLSLVAQAGCSQVVGVDLSLPRAAAAQRAGSVGLAAAASQLPFADAQFAAVWSGGLLHHLADDIASAVVNEIMRVTRAGGDAVIFDSVLPEPAWRRPVAWMVRCIDRGRCVRTQRAVEALLPQRAAWSCERFTYARNGLEGLWCTYKKTAVG